MKPSILDIIFFLTIKGKIMTAIREFIKVKEHEIHYKLPSDFDYDEVEIIILPKQKTDTQWQYWNDTELDNFGKISIGLSNNDFDDEEDYSKW